MRINAKNSNEYCRKTKKIYMNNSRKFDSQSVKVTIENTKL